MEGRVGANHMKILLTNDDGIHFKGLWALYKELNEHHTVVVVAPDRERSAVGHAITLNEPLRAARVEVNGGFDGYSVNGTPADCVKLGLLELLDFRPDVVIAGINPGANVGINLNYSGTVAAAKEAALCGVSAIAVSMDGYESRHYDDAAGFILKLAETVMEKKLPPGTFLNVNLPNLPTGKVAGIRFSRQGRPLDLVQFDRRVDPRDRAYYWQDYEEQRFESHPNADGTALNDEYISITPIKCDMTDYVTLEKLDQWDIKV